MRLWTIDFGFLDTQGLVALWRESLLASAVLRGETRGYRNHPQLERFRSAPDPVASINAYIHWVYCESVNRGLDFDFAKCGRYDFCEDNRTKTKIGQVAFELAHLEQKILVRKRADRRHGHLLREIGSALHLLKEDFRMGALYASPCCRVDSDDMSLEPASWEREERDLHNDKS